MALAGIVSGLLLQAAGPVQAGGYNLDHQNAAALGAAFAGSESARSQVAFAAYNPAAIGGAGKFAIAGSVTGVFPKAQYSNADATLLGVAPVAGQASDDGITKNAVVPNLSLSYSPIEKLSLGVVVNSTFGLDTDYTDNSIMRYQAQRSALRTVEVTPMAAYEVWPGIVLGAGLRVQYVDLSLTSIIDAGGIAAANNIQGFAPGSSDLRASFNGDDTSVGYTLGLQASPHRMIDLGIAYLSAIDHEVNGNAHYRLNTSAAGQVLNGAVGLFAAQGFETKLDTPGTLAIGFRLNATDDLRILFSERVLFWSRFDQVAVNFSDAATPTDVLTQEWKDSTMTSLGVEYDVFDGTTLRAGYMYDESPVRGRYASPRIPDSDRHWITAGLSHAFTSQLSADFGVAYAFFKDRRIRLNGASPENTFRGSLNADIEASAVAASLGLRYRF
ncbi:outer membrane protein transport protein [Myxococcota bacterium]|nr:outer membrane protein transport protein [Myxococcota bacterium]